MSSHYYISLKKEYQVITDLYILIDQCLYYLNNIIESYLRVYNTYSILY